MDRKILAIAITFVVLALVVPPATAGSSMMFRMDPVHSGDYSSVSGGFLPNNQLKWTFTMGDIVDSSPAVADGVVYAGSKDGNVYAINANDGSQKWVFPAGDDVFSSPAVTDSVVYVGSGLYCDEPRDVCGKGYVYAINANDGSQKWIFDEAGLIVHSSPAVADGVVYVGSMDGNVYAINANDGSQKWKFVTEGGFPNDVTDGSVLSSPAVADGVVYVGSGDGNVYAINANDGSQKWKFVTGDIVWSSPAVADGVVYVGSWDGNFYAINADDGSQKWKIVGDDISSSPAVADGVVYVGSEDGNVYAINANDGSQKWVFPTGLDVFSSPAVADGVVYIGSEDGNVYAINANDGSQKWKFVTGDIVWSSPAVADGVVYIGSWDNKVYAIGTGKQTPAITWSNPADITYGTPLSNTQLNAVAPVPGMFTYTPPAGTILDVGNNQNLHVDFTPTDSVNYNSASMDVKINVLIPTGQDLINKVHGLGLPKGIEQGLSAKPDIAEKMIAQEQYTPARNQLRAFINDVNAQRGKAMTPEQADDLIAIAQRIINAIPGK